MSISKLSTFQFIKTEDIIDLAVYYKFINWVAGEFDLLLMNDEDGLKVYFPNGWFSIRSFNKGSKINLEIKVESKSKKTGKKFTGELLTIYKSVLSCFEQNT